MAELRSQTLPPGGAALSPESSRRHQRRRLFAAVVASCAQHGYEATTISDLVRLSGVGRAHFYKYFETKEDCFLQAVRKLYDEGIRRAYAPYEGKRGDWEARIRAGFDQLVELIQEEPAAARMCVVELYAAGPKAREAADLAVEGFGAALLQAFQARQEPGEMPKEVPLAIVGGLHMLVHECLGEKAGDEVERLVDGVDDLVRWVTSYSSPPEELRQGRATRPSPPPRSEDPSERLLRATAALAAEQGYPSLSVNRIVDRAGTSMRALYKHFGGKDELFLACYERAVEGTLAAAAAGFELGGDWPEAIHAANQALLEYLASDPDFARVATVEVLAAGKDALRRRDQAINDFLPMLEGGFELAPTPRPRIWARAICFAIYSLIYREITTGGGPEALPRLGPTATYIDLAPFLGPQRAAEVANRTARWVDWGAFHRRRLR